MHFIALFRSGSRPTLKLGLALLMEGYAALPSASGQAPAGRQLQVTVSSGMGTAVTPVGWQFNLQAQVIDSAIPWGEPVAITLHAPGLLAQPAISFPLWNGGLVPAVGDGVSATPGHYTVTATASFADLFDIYMGPNWLTDSWLETLAPVGGPMESTVSVQATVVGLTGVTADRQHVAIGDTVTLTAAMTPIDAFEWVWWDWAPMTFGVATGRQYSRTMNGWGRDPNGVVEVTAKCGNVTLTNLITVYHVTDISPTSTDIKATNGYATFTAQMFPSSRPDLLAWGNVPSPSGPTSPMAVQDASAWAGIPGATTLTVACGSSSAEATLRVYGMDSLSGDGLVVPPGHPPLTFTANMLPDNDRMDFIEWQVDGVPVSGPPSLSITVTNLAIGHHVITASCGNTSKDSYVTVVGIKRIEYLDPESTNWVAVPTNVMYELVGTTLDFRAIPDPTWATNWPPNYPIWTWTPNGQLNDAVGIRFPFPVLASTPTNTVTLAAWSGTSYASVSALVFSANFGWSFEDGFPGRASNRAGLGEVIQFQITIEPVGVPFSATGLAWKTNFAVPATLTIGDLVRELSGVATPGLYSVGFSKRAQSWFASFDYVAPDGIVYYALDTNVTHSVNSISAGKTVTVRLQPTDVSFYNGTCHEPSVEYATTGLEMYLEDIAPTEAWSDSISKAKDRNDFPNLITGRRYISYDFTFSTLPPPYDAYSIPLPSGVWGGKRTAPKEAFFDVLDKGGVPRAYPILITPYVGEFDATGKAKVRIHNLEFEAPYDAPTYSPFE